MKTYEIIDEIRSNIQILLEEEYKRGYLDGFARGDKADMEERKAEYERGQADAKKEIEATEKHWGKKQYTLDNLQQQSDFSYMRGLNDAWECAKKIYDMEPEEYLAIFGKDPNSKYLVDLNAAEAVQKLKEYEEKQKCKTCGHYPPNGISCNGICIKCEDGNMYKPKQTDEIKVGDEVVLNDKSSYAGERGIIIAVDESQYPFHALLNNGDTEWLPQGAIDRKTYRNFPQIAEILKQMQEGKE